MLILVLFVYIVIKRVLVRVHAVQTLHALATRRKHVRKNALILHVVVVAAQPIELSLPVFVLVFVASPAVAVLVRELVTQAKELEAAVFARERCTRVRLVHGLRHVSRRGEVHARAVR